MIRTYRECLEEAGIPINSVKAKYGGYSLYNDNHLAKLCISERIVRPYATLQYKDDMYFIGYCESRKSILDFKICRIIEYAVLDEGFERDKDFKIEDAMKNCIGIYKGKEYDVKLIWTRYLPITLFRILRAAVLKLIKGLW